jgi:hypothetical protein
VVFFSPHNVHRLMYVDGFSSYFFINEKNDGKKYRTLITTIKKDFSTRVMRNRRTLNRNRVDL